MEYLVRVLVLASFSVLALASLPILTIGTPSPPLPPPLPSQGIVSTSSKSSSILRARPRKLSSSVACSRSSIMTTVTFPRPFHGSIFAKGYGPDACSVLGNGSRVIHFKTNANKCGIQVIDEEDTFEFQMYLYIQYDKGLDQNFDERIFVRCAPQEILLSGSMGRRDNLDIADGALSYKPLNPNLKALSEYDNSRIDIKTMETHEFAEGTVDKQNVESTMDILKGRPPNLRPIDGFVDIGEDVTIRVTVKNIDGIDSRISRCYAHDGTHTTKHNLTDDDGCTLDPVIMPNFKESAQSNGELYSPRRVLYTTFAAFKFPDKANLHIQCTLVICNTTCPKYDCDEPAFKASHRLRKRSSTLAQRYAPSGRIKKLIKVDPSAITTMRLLNGSMEAINAVPLAEVGLASSAAVAINRESDRKEEEDPGNHHHLNEARIELIQEKKNKKPTEEVLGGRHAEEDNVLLSCLASPSVLLTFVLLFCALLAALTFAICMSVKVKALGRRLATYEVHHHHGGGGGRGGVTGTKRAFYPYHTTRNSLTPGSYGRMVDASMAGLAK